MPAAGAHELRVISPHILELTLITTKRSTDAPPAQWNFIDEKGRARLPEPRRFVVLVGDRTNRVRSIGFKRRVLYAPLKERDLRIANALYLELQSPIAESARVEVRNPDQTLWPAQFRFAAACDPFRWSPAIHVNQVGYLPSGPKQAMVGYYLGSAGELDVPNAVRARAGNASDTNAPDPAPEFVVIESASNKEVFRGPLRAREDHGFPFPSYQRVLEADFSAFREAGEYRIAVPGLGASFPFRIGDGVAGVLARTYALGIYHQRCGTGNALPFTRFTHGPCHTAPAEVPVMSSRFESVNHVLEQESDGAKENPRHKAARLNSVAASLYPMANRGPIDVRGGHHDAGDYSKYTANSAMFIHLLVFAADNFPGVHELDNLGIPESGDGKSDVLQEARWEADFLAKMQDTDGGFYFLVYPRDRRYENDVTPDHGDPQVVFPKTTAATASAVAALAQCASSPRFKEQFPDEAAAYLEKARKGWGFLERAIARHGKDGAYQKITHYGDDFMHDDELAWAACEMFLATRDAKFQDQLVEWMDPADPNFRKWSWWRLFDAAGNATRSYAFGARSGRIDRDLLLSDYLRRCEDQIIAAGQDQLQRARQSAYGTSFPIETKRTASAGWYFSGDAAFDLAVACQLDYPARNDPRAAMLDALYSNLSYEAGRNPVHVAYLTGIGWKRQREIVHQYAQNDRRILPPTGIPLGNIQAGFGWLDPYGQELGQLTFPPDADTPVPYPFYDRWGDSFNLTTEFVISNQAKALAAAAWLMARTDLKTQKWKPATAQIRVAPAQARVNREAIAQLIAPDLDLRDTQIVWEARGQEPALGAAFTFKPAHSGEQWIEAEALLPDGRRIFAETNITARP